MKHLALLLIFLYIISCSSKDNTSLDNVPSESVWMNSLLKEFPDKNISLLDITFPQSHDAGLYVLTKCTFGANACNTQTQHLPLKDQLMQGIRSFDIRPVLTPEGYYTQHASACDGGGCIGDSMENILNATADFLREHPELVFLRLGHFCGTSWDDENLRSIIHGALGDFIYTEPDGADAPFIARPLKDIIPPENNSGRALLLYDGAPETEENVKAGVYTSSVLPSAGGWSNVFIYSELEADQESRFVNFVPDGSALFEFSWTLTQDNSLALACAGDPDGARSIEDMALEANSHLSEFVNRLIKEEKIRKDKIPNFISADLANKDLTAECLKICRLNLEP